jgi:hypothetical protein
MPVLLGKGQKLLENIDIDKIKLERSKIEETTPVRTSISLRVTKTNPDL